MPLGAAFAESSKRSTWLPTMPSTPRRRRRLTFDRRCAFHAKTSRPMECTSLTRHVGSTRHTFARIGPAMRRPPRRRHRGACAGGRAPLSSAGQVKASIVVNDRAQEIPAGGGTLLSFLREELGLTGAKPGCGEGACGACTVLVDGEAVRACTTDVNDVAGRSVVTIEGLSRGGMLHPVARAFLEIGAMQCGYCTPGMVITAAALLARIPAPAEAEIKTAMAGNVCRCCAYPRILRAVTRVAVAEQFGDASATSVAEDAAPADLRAATGTPWDLLEPEARGYFDVLGDGLVVVLPPGQTSRGRPRPSWPGSMNGGAWIHVGAQGIVTAFTGKVDMGQDNRTTLTLLVAEELRAPLATVRLLMGDTAVSPFDIGTFGSRSVIDAGEDLRLTAASTRDHLVLLAADGWDRDPAELEAADARVRERRGDLSSTCLFST